MARSKESGPAQRSSPKELREESRKLTEAASKAAFAAAEASYFGEPSKKRRAPGRGREKASASARQEAPQEQVVESVEPTAPLEARDERVDYRGRLAALLKEFDNGARMRQSASTREAPASTPPAEPESDQAHLVRIMEEATPASVTGGAATRPPESPQEVLDEEVSEMDAIAKGEWQNMTTGKSEMAAQWENMQEGASSKTAARRKGEWENMNEGTPAAPPPTSAASVPPQPQAASPAGPPPPGVVYGEQFGPPAPPTGTVTYPEQFGPVTQLLAAQERLKNAATPQEAQAAREEMARLRTEKAGIGAEREALRAAEQQVVDQETAFERRHIADRIIRRVTGVRTKKLAPAKNEMDQAASAYKQKLEERLANRQSEKTAGGEDRYAAIHAAKAGYEPLRKQADGTWAAGGTRSSPEEFKKKVADRYRRAVVHKEVIAQGEEARRSKIAEVRLAKEQSWASASFAFLIDRNAALERRLGKTGARVARALVAGGLGASAAFLTGGVAPAGLAVLGLAGTRAGRSFIGGTVGAGAAKLAGSVYERTGAAKRRSAREASKSKVEGDVTAISEMRAAYRAGSEETIAKHRRGYQALAAILGGASVSLASADWWNTRDALPQVPNHHELDTVPPSPKMPMGTAADLQSHEIPAPGEPPFHMGNTFQPEAPAAHPVPPEAPQASPTPTPEVPAAPGAPAAPEAPHASATPVAPETHAPSAAGAASEAHNPRVATGPVGVSVEVKQGYGYETMVRELAGKLKGQQLSDYPPGSDAYNLIKGMQDAKLNGAILEVEKAHEFLKATGRSTLIPEGAHLTIGADGNLHYYDAQHPDIIQAPEGARTTPPVHPVPHAPTQPEAGLTTDELNHEEIGRIEAGEPPAIHPHVEPPPAPAEAAPHAAPPIPAEAPPRMHTPEEYLHPEAPAAPLAPPTPEPGPPLPETREAALTGAGASAGAMGAAAGFTRAGQGEGLSLGQANAAPPVAVAAERREAVAPSAMPTEVFTTNNGVHVDPKRAAIYMAGTKESPVPMAYGGTHDERMAAEEVYARAHKGEKVYGQSEVTDAQGVKHPFIYATEARGFFNRIVRTPDPRKVSASNLPPAELLDKFISPEDFIEEPRPAVVA